ncbi:hypothetical protein ACIGKL_18910 [Pseudomonas sp. NPDC077186]|uniref:hypothetical protein n=1 Tax=Pseudomonas sp. NPDC077186 TaxID=3364421 RepID=UPI0037C6C540
MSLSFYGDGFGSKNMCAPNHLHPETEHEYNTVKINGNTTQKVVITNALVKAVTACALKDMTHLQQSSLPNQKGKLFLAEYSMRSTLGASTMGQAVAAIYQDGKFSCWDVLACDVTGSSWLLGTNAPEVRANNRIP